MVKHWKERHLLLMALALLGTSGMMLHIRIHPFIASDTLQGHYVSKWSFFSATILPLLDVVLVTPLFSTKRTAVYGYLLNGLIVIYGTVLMAHFSIADLTARSAPLYDWVFRSTLPDVGIAWADFMIGKLLYHSWIKNV